MSKQFKYRLLFSSIVIIALIFSIYYSTYSYFKPIFILLTVGIISSALKEYYDIAEIKGFKPLTKIGIATSIAFVLSLSLRIYYPNAEHLTYLVLLISSILFFLFYFNRPSSALANLAITFFGIVYLVIPLSSILAINYFPSGELQDGRLWLAYTLIVSKITDIGAYFVGKIWGKTQLTSYISPKKTVEGALGGSALALLTSLFFSFFIHTSSFTLTIGQSLWLGLSLSILAQLGDLSESLLKRDAGVKDSSHLPGLGGVLDVVDSLVFTFPLMYLLLRMHVLGS